MYSTFEDRINQHHLCGRLKFCHKYNGSSVIRIPLMRTLPDCPDNFGPNIAQYFIFKSEPLACRDCGFESRRGHGCLSLVNVVCCRVQVSSSGLSLVPRKPQQRCSLGPNRGSCSTRKNVPLKLLSSSSYIVRYSIFAVRGFTLVLSDDFLYVTCTAEFSLGVPGFLVIRSLHIFRMTAGVLCTDLGN